jgi:hypothetical protein
MGAPDVRPARVVPAGRPAAFRELELARSPPWPAPERPNMLDAIVLTLIGAWLTGGCWLIVGAVLPGSDRAPK